MHGAVAGGPADPQENADIADALRLAGGVWQGHGHQYQANRRVQYDPDGWARYPTKRMSFIRVAIGGHAIIACERGTSQVARKLHQEARIAMDLASRPDGPPAEPVTSSSHSQTEVQSEAMAEEYADGQRTQMPADLRSELKQAVGPLLLQLPDMDVQGLGTCFVIGAMGQFAIAVTAAHCLEEASKYDIPTRAASAPSSLFQVERREQKWNRIELSTLLSHPHVPPFMSLPVDVEEAFSNLKTDVAFLLVTPDEDYREAIKLTRQIGLLSAGPDLGEKVLVAGYFETEVRTFHHRESDGKAVFQAVSGKFQVVEAAVTGVFPQGIRDIKWPCFQLDCPLFSGMSGGCVLVTRGTNLLAAGVISRDLSLSAAASGEAAFAAIIGPSLETRFPPKQYQRDQEAAVQVASIADLVALGVIEDLTMGGSEPG